MLKNVVLIVSAILPVIILLKFIFDKDYFEKEPSILLLKLFIAGILSAVLTLFLSFILSKIFLINNNFYHSFIKVALVEELSKWLFIYFITWKSKEFNYMYDAIVYSIFVSLGFACLENIIYVFHYGIFTSLLRAVISIPGHAFFAIYMGYYLGISKIYYINDCDKRGFNYKIYSLILPTILHGIYDYCLFSGIIFFYVAFVFFLIFLFILSLKKVNRLSNIDVTFENK